MTEELKESSKIHKRRQLANTFFFLRWGIKPLLRTKKTQKPTRFPPLAHDDSFTSYTFVLDVIYSIGNGTVFVRQCLMCLRLA